MLLFSLAFLIGDVYLQSFKILPELQTVVLYGIICFFVIFIWVKITKIHRSMWCILLGLILGWLWGYTYASVLLSWKLDQALEGEWLILTGHISSVPKLTSRQNNFLFYIEQLRFQQTTYKSHVLVYLSWRNPSSHLQVGDQWQLSAKLKRIHSTQNPGAFDFEAWALQNGIRAIGVINAKSIENKLLARHPYRFLLQSMRQLVLEKLQMYLPHSSTAAWLPALIVGERRGIPQEQWQILRNTGTNHLMAIAGLHIGIISGLVYGVASWLWRRSTRLLLGLPAQQVAACAALITALFYSALAGFSIPTKRACLMLIILIVAVLLRQKISQWYVWSLALILVLLINPLHVLSESFWLSFGTIALIIYGMHGRLAPRGFWWKWFRVQWVIGWGLIPITMIFFQQCSFTSFIANSIAIPWLGFLILPFCLLAILFLFVSPMLVSYLLIVADRSLWGLWGVLSWLSHLNFSVWFQAIPTTMILFITVIAFIFLLLPQGFPGKWLGILWLTPLIFYQNPKPNDHEFWLTLLDVGQGLSAIVQTKSHVLIFDTGAKYSESDMGDRVILPFLHHRGIRTIDMLVISHGDNDHCGGAQTLLRTLKIHRLKTSVMEKFPKQASPCLSGEHWRWDGVDFSFLYPAVTQFFLGNDSSCVLQVSNGYQSVLLTGDIEKYAEQILVETQGENLGANILIAPHHGSKTSGLPAFIKLVHPQIVLYAIGYRNRYHFPHQSILRAYNNIHAQQFTTAESGAIFLKITDKVMIEQHRKQYSHYWLNRNS